MKIIISLCLLLLINCSGKGNYPDGSSFALCDSMVIKREDIIKGTFVVSYIPYQNGNINGNIKIFVNDIVLNEVLSYKDGKKHGKCFVYECSTVTGEYNYFNGKREGQQKQYFIDGSLQQIEHYKNNRLDGKAVYFSKPRNGSEGGREIRNFKNGVIHGTLTAETLDGFVFLEEHYKEGKLHGEMKLFDRKTKKIKWHKIFDNGKTIKTIVALPKEKNQ